MNMTDEKCLKCGYTWTPKVANPKKCPRCNQPLHPYKLKPEAKPSEIVPVQPTPRKGAETIQAITLVYCPFCGAKLPIYTPQTTPIEEEPTEEQPTEEQPTEEQPTEEQPTEEESEEEEIEPLDLKPRKSYAELNTIIKELASKLDENLDAFIVNVGSRKNPEYEFNEEVFEKIKDAYTDLGSNVTQTTHPTEAREQYESLRKDLISVINALFQSNPKFPKGYKDALKLWREIEKDANKIADLIEA
jgi:DNA-directed RNA polymerase subunit RPC12/RpoP